MSVQELTTLHQRYVDLSNRFRAAWAYQQFLQSLRKIFVESAAPRQAIDFQEVYNELKEVSHNLNASETERIRVKLDVIERQLARLSEALLDEDSRVPAAYLRQVFRRVKGQDDKVLTQLLKFYLYSRVGRELELSPQRLDKVDFLVTKLGTEAQDGVSTTRDRKHLREIFEGLWALAHADEPLEREVDERVRSVEAIRFEMGQVQSLDALTDSYLVQRYRDLKRGLGPLFFEPDVLSAVLEANVALKNLIQRLHRQEERQIVSDYQQIFELEREVPVDIQLDQELSQFHVEIERFEKQLQREEMKLDDLAQIKHRVRSLMPRLTSAQRLTPPAEEPTATAHTSPGYQDDVEEVMEEGEPAVGRPEVPSGQGFLAEPYDRLVAALEGTDPDASPRSVALKPEVFPFHLEPREVVAFRRLQADWDCDREVERFVLEAAALRVRLNEDAAEIGGIVDDTSFTGEAPIFDQARSTVRLAGEYLGRYEHLVEQAVLDGNPSEAQSFQVLRMRLMRDYASLWLLGYKPYLRRAGASL